MRARAVVLGFLCSASLARADSHALFWVGSDSPYARPAERGFAEGVGLPVGRMTRETESAPAKLGPLLDEARAQYKKFAFADALAKLDDLAGKAEREGGGDLDATQLSDVYFYRWLCKGELGKSDGSWDDLVQAARLAPTRVIDAAQVAPRAVAAWKRAVGEVSSTRVHLTVTVPTESRLVIDGVAADPFGEVIAGRHFVQIVASGLERWHGIVDVAPPSAKLAPTLRPISPPDIEALPRVTGERLVLGTLERTIRGFRFRVQQLEGDGHLTSESVDLTDEETTRDKVAELAKHVANPPVSATAPVVTAQPVLVQTAPPRNYKKIIVGVAVGGALAVVAGVAIGLGIVYGHGPSPGTATVGGVK